LYDEQAVAVTAADLEPMESINMWRHFVVFWGQFIVNFSKKEIVLLIFKM